ncbi:LPXTG cell wall anchor domain-containing protein, partial [Limosilactobacillus reuteri]
TNPTDAHKDNNKGGNHDVTPSTPTDAHKDNNKGGNHDVTPSTPTDAHKDNNKSDNHDVTPTNPTDAHKDNNKGGNHDVTPSTPTDAHKDNNKSDNHDVTPTNPTDDHKNEHHETKPSENTKANATVEFDLIDEAGNMHFVAAQTFTGDNGASQTIDLTAPEGYVFANNADAHQNITFNNGTIHIMVNSTRQGEKELPKTGNNAGSVMALAGIMLASGLALFGINNRKKN